MNKISVDIPLKWWLFHLYIRHDFETSQPRDKKWVYHSSELEEKAKSVGIRTDPVSDKSTSEFYAMVKLFHHLTFWVNFESHSPHQPPQDTQSLSDYIVTHPASLYKYISKLVNIQERDNLEPSQEEFKGSGRFTKAILEEISFTVISRCILQISNNGLSIFLSTCVLHQNTMKRRMMQDVQMNQWRRLKRLTTSFLLPFHTTSQSLFLNVPL